jgi:rhodanese-related sulfurtransferase
MQEFIDFSSNNPWLVSGLFASALAVIFNELRLRSRDIGSLGAAMAVRLINDGAMVVDVRDADKFSAGHIGNARNIQEKELLEHPDRTIKANKQTLLICDTGARSSECVAKLRKGGLDNVFSLKGGLASWQQDNLPLVT